VNILVDQYWHMTNADPPSPIKKRVIDSDAVLFTSPIHAHGIDADIKTTAIKIRAPYLSQRGPRTNRMTIVPATEQMLDVQISFASIPRESLTSESKGAIANQIKKAMKKDHHEQWNARIWGLAKLHSLISVALSFWFGSVASA